MRPISTNNRHNLSLLAVTTSVVALIAGGVASTAARAEEATPKIEEIVVTGSRVVSDGSAQPTPVTVLSADKLLLTEPANISRALTEMPQFAQSQAERGVGFGISNSSGAYLNLRQFGNQRNLVLLDGIRLPPTATTGAVDTNIIPQSLVQRVDVVTGGASAVYGSDAITGVINFVLDHDFNGTKFAFQSGLTGLADVFSWRGGVTYGTPIGSRGHFEATYDHYHVDRLPDYTRTNLGNPNMFTQVGTGTPSNPYRLIKNGRWSSTGAPGGATLATTGPLANIVFKANGVPSPYVHGAPTGITGTEEGGDGTYYDGGTILTPLTTDQLLGRFDYDVGEDMTAHVQASWNRSATAYPYAPLYFYNETILSGNAFLPASMQQTMTANNIASFQFGRINEAKQGYISFGTDGQTQSAFFNTGLAGKVFDGWSWDANYTYTRTFQHYITPNNVSNGKTAAALDAVTDPATGRVVCQVSLTQYANLYPGCEPLNLFGPTAPTVRAFDWITDDTYWTLANLLHDATLSVSGAPMSTWAGEVVVALTGEYRWQQLRNISTVQASQPADCTGLRANCVPGSTAQYFSGTNVNMQASQAVKEGAVEFNIPLAKDAPFFSSVQLNLAGRYTDYDTSGGVYSWKIGGTWDVNDEFRVRGTRSRDIRAPTLYDLFSPFTVTNTAPVDLHTGLSRQVLTNRQGNPNLVPEIGYTNTVGFVYRPAWIPRFSLAVDYYAIDMANAIVSLAGGDARVQQDCENSNGTSQLCTLIIRPLPFSDRTPANFPTRLLATNLNAARQWTRGVDVETNYNFDLAEVFAEAPGTLDARFLAAYQPLLRSLNIPGTPYIEQAGVAGQNGVQPGIAKWRLNASLNYTLDQFSTAVKLRWQSSLQPTDRRLYTDLRPDIPPYFYADVTFNYQLEVGAAKITPFLTIQNLFNKQPPVIGGSPTGPGLVLPVAAGFDVAGRYFTVGMRGRF